MFSEKDFKGLKEILNKYIDFEINNLSDEEMKVIKKVGLICDSIELQEQQRDIQSMLISIDNEESESE